MTSYNQIAIKETITKGDQINIQALIDACNKHDTIDFPLNAEKAPDCGLLAYRGDTLLGFAYLMGKNNVEVLGTVHPEHRRQRVGHQLLEATKAFCRRNEAQKLTLASFGTIPASTAFAEAVGGKYIFSEYNLVLDPTAITPSVTISEGLSLSLATSDNVTEIADISIEAFEEEEEEQDEIRAWLAKDILRAARRFFLVKLYEKSIGTIGVVESAPDKIDITTFCILASHRRHGYGRQILRQVVSMLQSESWPHISLDVETENAKALSLYLSCGFRQANVYNYYHIGL